MGSELAPDRDEYLNASEMPDVVEVGWEDPATLWVRKRAALAGRPLPRAPENEAIKAGRLLENTLIEWAIDEAGYDPTEFELQDRHTRGIFGATCDASSSSLGVGVEAKCTAVTGDWGDPAIGQVPQAVLVQTQMQMYCAGLDRVLVPALLSGWRLGVRLYVLERNDELIKILVRNGEEFWGYVKSGEHLPDDWLPSLEVLRQTTPEIGKVTHVPRKLIDFYENTKAQLAEAKRLHEKSQRRVAMALGDAEIGVWDEAGRVISFKQQSRKKYKVPKEVKEQYRVDDTVTRTMRIQKMRRCHIEAIEAQLKEDGVEIDGGGGADDDRHRDVGGGPEGLLRGDGPQGAELEESRQRGAGGATEES